MEKGKFRYKFDSKLKIVFKEYFGGITIGEIESSWEHAFEHHLIPDNAIGFVLDFRQSEFVFSPGEYIHVVNFYRKHIKYFRGRKIGLVTTSPKDIVIPVLFSTKDVGYSSKSFSTIDAAVNWVMR